MQDVPGGVLGTPTEHSLSTSFIAPCSTAALTIHMYNESV